MDSSTLIDIKFANAKKLIWLDNKKDMQGQMETLYTKSDKDVILSAYYKINLAIF